MQENRGSRQLNARVMKARAAVLFARVKGDVTIVPGTEGKQYRVTRVRSSVRPHILQLQCQNADTLETCKGSQHGTLCYHQVAAAEKAAAEKGMSIYWYVKEEDARKLEVFGATVYKAESVDGYDGLWMAVMEVRGSDQKRTQEQRQREAEKARDESLPVQKPRWNRKRLFKAEG